MLLSNGTTSIHASQPSESGAHGILKILLVDDEPNTVQLVRRILQADGHEVHEAFDGEQAIEMYNRVYPDLILLDAVIPKMDGLTVLNEIRRRDKTTGIIMFSALTSELLALQAMQFGADDFVNKPFTLKTLRMHIRRVIDKVHLRQHNVQLQQQLVDANEKLRYYMSPPLVRSLMDSPTLPQLGGNRQTVTVLFLDITGFSSIAQALPPDEVLRLLNDYFAFVSAAVVENEGMVDKILGDGFMALFNVPLAHADHATSALRTAIAINTRSAEWNQNHHIPLHARIGIHTGEAVVGNIGTQHHMNYTAIGDTVNLAKRLEEAAQAGEIMVSAETYRLADLSKLDIDPSQITRLESVQLKGRAKSIEIYQFSFASAVEMTSVLSSD